MDLKVYDKRKGRDFRRFVCYRSFPFGVLTMQTSIVFCILLCVRHRKRAETYYVDILLKHTRDITASEWREIQS